MNVGKQVFLLCAGSASRWNGQCKQLLDIDGEPLLHRTIRLLHDIDPEIPITIVSWRPELRIAGCRYLDTHFPTLCLAASMLLTVPHWKEINYILMGDVVFNQDVLEKILAVEKVTTFGSRVKAGGLERVAIALPRNTPVDGMIRAVTSGTYAGNEVPNNFFRWYHLLFYRWCYWDGGILGYLHFHILHPFYEWFRWNIPDANPVDLEDPRVIDFDSREEYEQYRHRQDKSNRSGNTAGGPVHDLPGPAHQ